MVEHEQVDGSHQILTRGQVEVRTLGQCRSYVGPVLRCHTIVVPVLQSPADILLTV